MPHPRPLSGIALLLAASVLPASLACDAGARDPDDAAPPAENEIVPSAVAEGDTIARLRVTRVDLRPMVDDSAVWTGTVRFEGELELAGVYQPHFDYPEVTALCFHPDTASARRVPRLAPDARTQAGRKRWFCFRNTEAARAAFEPVTRPREAVVVVRDYAVSRYFTDAWDEADLVRVVELGRERAPTLREPAAQPVVELAAR